MTVKGGTSAACAACKYQRRKCAPDCQLAPYFPPDNPRQFQNVHRLFGVSNILKILSKIDDPLQKSEAMRSIICQANIRDRDPIYGCVGVIYDLYVKIQHAQLELDAVNADLAAMRGHLDDVSSAQCGALPLFHNDAAAAAATRDDRPVFDAVGSECLDLNQLWGSQDRSFIGSSSSNHNHYPSPPMAAPLQSPFHFSSSSHATIAAEGAGSAGANVHDYDEISPYFDDVQQSYIDSKEEAYDSRLNACYPQTAVINQRKILVLICPLCGLESSLKETMQSVVNGHVSESELKSAAACFSLTSIS